MTDPRPSEDDRPWPGFRAAGFFDHDAPTDVEETDPLMDFMGRAKEAHLPEQGLVYAQLATARAVMENTTQLRAITQALSTLVVIFDGGAR